MKKTILHIYTLLVCFICLLFLGPSAYKISYNLFKLNYTDFSISAEFYNKHILSKTKEGKPIETIKAESIAWQNQITYEKRKAKQDLVQNVIQIIIVLLIFLPHIGLYLKNNHKAKRS